MCLLVSIGQLPWIFKAKQVDDVARQRDVENLHDHQVGIPCVGEDVQVACAKDKKVEFLRFERDACCDEGKRKRRNKGKKNKKKGEQK